MEFDISLREKLNFSFFSVILGVVVLLPQHFGVSGVEAQESKNSNVNRENVLLGKNFLILITMSEKRKTQNDRSDTIYF